jgi:hypothetical protein
LKFRDEFLRRYITIDQDFIGRVISTKRNIGWQDGILFVNLRSRAAWAFKKLMYRISAC